MTFSFDGYTVRPITERDRAYLELLIEADDYHRGRMTADFFLQLNPGEDAWAMEDDEHRIVFYFKTSTAVRIALQFADWGGYEATRRNQSALAKGLHWIEGVLRANKFTEILFDTDGGDLRRFAKRRMGFVALETLSKYLTHPHGLGRLPTTSGGKVVSGVVRSEFAADANHERAS